MVSFSFGFLLGSFFWSLLWPTSLSGTLGGTAGGCDFLNISARVFNAYFFPFLNFTNGIVGAGLCNA